MQIVTNSLAPFHTDAGLSGPCMLRGGHPDECDHPDFPPGWEAEMELDMQRMEHEQAEHDVEESHGRAAREAYAHVKANVGTVIMHAERVRSEVFGDLGSGDSVAEQMAAVFEYRIYLFRAATVDLIGSGTSHESYLEAARSAVMNHAERRARGAA